VPTMLEHTAHGEAKDFIVIGQQDSRHVKVSNGGTECAGTVRSVVMLRRDSRHRLAGARAAILQLTKDHPIRPREVELRLVKRRPLVERRDHCEVKHNDVSARITQGH
jgi:hypothetical protein